MEILSQFIDDLDGYYRVRMGSRVHYIVISVDVFDEETLTQPQLLIPNLPELPNSPWTTMMIWLDDDGVLKTSTSISSLPKIQRIWHRSFIDVLDLKIVHRLRPGVHEVRYNGTPAIAKIACFEWDMAKIERETWAYSILARFQSQHPDELPIAPNFIGHLTENGRPMGLLLQKVEGGPACLDDLPSCVTLVRNLHRAGLIHCAVSRSNFLIDRTPGRDMRLIGFERAQEFDMRMATEELMSLPADIAR